MWRMRTPHSTTFGYKVGRLQPLHLQNTWFISSSCITFTNEINFLTLFTYQFNFSFFFSTYLGARENELGTNTALIRALKYAAIGTITIHVMSCVWYSLACANEGAAVEGQIRKVTSCDPDSWAIKLNTGKTS